MKHCENEERINGLTNIWIVTLIKSVLQNRNTINTFEEVKFKSESSK